MKSFLDEKIVLVEPIYGDIVYESYFRVVYNLSILMSPNLKKDGFISI